MNDPKQPDVSSEEFSRLWIESEEALGGYIYLFVRDFQHAEDIQQEVARSAIRTFAQYDSSRPFSAWLIGIAKRRIVDYYRKQGRRLPIQPGAVMQELAAAIEKPIGSQSERAEALRSCLALLNPRYRKLVEMKYDRLLSSEQMAAELEVKANHVNVLLFRIRKSLASCVLKRLRLEESP